jgi:hypothetical protein
MAGPGDRAVGGTGGAPGVLAARLALLARLGAFPARLAEVARAVEAAEAVAGRPPGEWSAREVVAHLVAVEGVVWQARLDSLAAAGPDATLPAWSWVEPGPVDDPSVATLDGALGLFAAGRALTLERLASLDEEGWSRTGIHATYGPLDLAGLLRIAADHDDEHLDALEARATD